MVQSVSFFSGGVKLRLFCLTILLLYQVYHYVICCTYIYIHMEVPINKSHLLYQFI